MSVAITSVMNKMNQGFVGNLIACSFLGLGDLGVVGGGIYTRKFDLDRNGETGLDAVWQLDRCLATGVIVIKNGRMIC